MSKILNIASGRHSKGTAMKTLISLTAGVALAVSAGVASAQTPAEIQVGGTATAICTLPSTWQTRTNIGGTLGTFDGGHTWNIPSTSFATSTGEALVTGEIALRITGQGFCNTSHTFTMTTQNGGMTLQGGAPVPSGFASRREVKYDAHWVNSDSNVGTARRTGTTAARLVDWIPAVAGESRTRNWAAAAEGGIPGSRYFDLRLSVRRTNDTNGAPLVAGAYQDVVTITLSPTP